MDGTKYVLVCVVFGTVIGPFLSYELAKEFAIKNGLVATHRSYPVTDPGEYNG